MEWIYLLLAAVVIAFGVAVLFVARRRSAAGASRPTVAEPIPPVEPPPEPPAEPTTAPTIVERPGDGSGDAGEADAEPPAGIAVVERPTLRSRMGAARSAFASAFGSVLGRSRIGTESWDDLEEALLRADVGLGVTTTLLDGVRQRVADERIEDPERLLGILSDLMRAQLSDQDRSLRFEESMLNVWMFVGVNGVGKTTTIGKVAAQQVALGRRVLLAAGDTFRAAAAEQLGTWAERAGTDFVRGAEGGDPSAVIFDGVERAAARHLDLVLADTAGRLHTKSNLMDELSKVRRVAERGAGTVTETLLVIDATTGQNGLVQAREFREATDVTGVVLTKLDGSAKGGIVFAIETELGIPVKLVGVGETIDDLVPFDPAEFVTALFDV